MDVFTDTHTHDEASTDAAIARKLIGAFMQFGRVEWHQRSIMGYKPSEIRVLFCIMKGDRAGSGEITVSEISKRLRVTSPTVTQLIKGLEAEGLIERAANPADRRVVDIKLTEKGVMVTQQARHNFLESIKGLIEYLGEEQSDQFAELLLKASHYYKTQASSSDHPYWNGDSDI
jgi:DNA-binding MarR family transcriptional regulator